MIYRPEIDGLRAIAVLSVVLCHAGISTFAGGFAGVDVFFVISGFLITQILAQDLDQGQFSLLRFYERRARRILPALVVMVLATVLPALYWMLPFQRDEYGQSVIGVGLFLSNVAFLLQSGYFATDAGLKPLLHTWSLAVEEQFYLIYPLMLWALWRVGARLRLMGLGAMIVASLAAAEFGARHWPDANFYLIPFRAWELLIGAVAALAVLSVKPRENDGFALTGLALILLPMLVFDESVPFPSLWTLVPVAGTALVLVFGGAGTRAARLLSVRPVVAVGLISYSVYLWHQPLLAFGRLAVQDELPLWASVALAALSLPIGWASWAYVEQPFRGGRAILTRRTVLTASVVALMAVTVLGAVVPSLPGLRKLPDGVLSAAALEALRDERMDVVGEGRCHLRKSSELDDFLAQWNCLGTAADGRAATVAIYGDSHAADTAGAVRLAGGNVLQLTGASCPLVGEGGKKDYCQALIDKVLTETQSRGIRTIVLVNYFPQRGITAASLQAIAEFWTTRFDRVYLISPTPDYPRLSEKLLYLAPADLRQLRPSLKRDDAFRAALDGVDLKGMVLLDGPAIFCRDRPDCAPFVDGTLMIDEHHLSAAGMALYGRNLLSDAAGPFAQP